FVSRDQELPSHVPSQFLTPWLLVQATARELHRVARRQHRDRWAFLKGQRVQEPHVLPSGFRWSRSPVPVDVRRHVIGNRALFCGEAAAGLVSTIRMLWNCPGRPGRPLLLVDFAVPTQQQPGAGPPQASPQAARHGFTLRVDLYAERRRVGPFTKRTVGTRPQGDREALWRLYQRARRESESVRVASRDIWIPPRDWKQWWVDCRVRPGASLEQRQQDNHDHEIATAVVLLLYLWQEKMISLG